MAAAAGLKQVKQALRTRVRVALQGMSGDVVERESRRVTAALVRCPEIVHARAISVYLSKERELRTHLAIQHLMKLRKCVYVPRVVGPAPGDMHMVRLRAAKDVEGFPVNVWGVPEPPADYAAPGETCCAASGEIDTVIVPGMAFNSSGVRLGHGKGYYDCFLNRLTEARLARNLPPPKTVGVCLSAQLLEEDIPVEPHDRFMDRVLAPEGLFPPLTPEAHSHALHSSDAESAISVPG